MILTRKDLIIQHVSDSHHNQLISEAITKSGHFLFDLCFSEETGKIRIRLGPSIPNGTTMDQKEFLDLVHEMESKLRQWATSV